MTETVRKPRSVHPPFTDEEWFALKVEAARSGRSIGETIADLWIKTTNGSAASPVRKRSRAANTNGG